MISYLVKVPKTNLSVVISVNSSAPHSFAPITYQGQEEAIAFVKDWLEMQYGAFGHLLTDSTTPVDLAAAMTQSSEYQPELLEGAELIRKWAPDLPPGATT